MNGAGMGQGQKKIVGWLGKMTGLPRSGEILKKNFLTTPERGGGVRLIKIITKKIDKIIRLPRFERF